jgi:hypothetical protein
MNKEFSVGAIHPFSSPLAPPSNEKEILCFGFWAFTPNPSAQNPKRKKKFENFLKQFRLLSEKRKGIHQLTAYIWLRFASGEPPPIFCSATLRKTSDIRER